MLEFASPIFLSVPAAVGVLGVWALWRGQRRQRPVSSLRLWRGLEGQAKGGRRRVMDPLWMLVLLAGLLAGLALAGPRWVKAAPVPLAVEWSVRSAPSNGTGPGAVEAWVRCPQVEGAGELRINGTPRALSVADLRQGVALPVTPDAFGRVRLELQAAGGRGTEGRAAATFRDAPDLRAFGLLEAAARDVPVDPALRRVFGIQPGARPDDPGVVPRVLLVNDPQVSPEELTQADLVVALPPAALPDLTLGGELRSPPPGASGPAGWTPAAADGGSIAWPSFVKLQDVHVMALRQITAAGDWQPLAMVNAGGQKVPWILMRATQTPDGRPALWMYLASAPATQTDWPKSPGFVLFFAEMQQRVMSPQAAAADWAVTPDGATSAVPPIALESCLGAAAMVLLIAAIGWYLARAP